MRAWRVAAAGLADDRVWSSLLSWRSIPDALLVAVSDPDPLVLNRARRELGVGRTYEDWKQLITGERFEFLHVASPPRCRADVIEAAAERGIHCLVEGTLAHSLDASERILSAVRRHRVKLLANWPHARSAAVLHAARLVEEGHVGQLFSLTSRSAFPPLLRKEWSDAHSSWFTAPALDGGGALVAGCAAGANLCRSMIGVPNSCSCSAGSLVPGSEVQEDNAVLIASYRFATATMESSFTQVAEAGPLATLRGTSGTLAIYHDRLELVREGSLRPVELSFPPLPEELCSPAAELLHALLHDHELTGFCNPQVARDTQEILEAGIHSVEQGKTVRLPLR